MERDREKQRERPEGVLGMLNLTLECPTEHPDCRFITEHEHTIAYNFRHTHTHTHTHTQTHTDTQKRQREKERTR